MKIDILDDETWERLTRGAESIPDNWSRRCEESIRKEKREVEKRYGIRIGQTEIYCARCGKVWPHGCAHSPRENIEYNRPMIGKSNDDYRKELSIDLGMLKEEALEKFREWRSTKKMCERCEGEKYVEFCSFHLICEEAEKESNNGEIEPEKVADYFTG